ncbi:MAG: (2Fe-2S) ferredoxin domain-containing protein, partial [Thermomicrobia bacterium]|nr:(2Fe-2S) ferredoxin domain-containing protein [Thermomicrobia bacterium]
MTEYLVHLCFGSNCTLAGSRKLLRVLEEEIAALGISDRVTIVPATCRNRCDWSPSMNVLPGN